MNLLRKTMTRRTALLGSAAGLALAACGGRNRPASLVAAHSAAPLSETSAATPTPAPAASDAAAAATTVAASSSAPAAVAGAAATTTVVPAGGAGLFNVDPDQGSVNQDPHVVVTGDIAALPLDMEL